MCPNPMWSSQVFLMLLFVIDRDVARSTAEQRCPCGGRLHVSDYRRKPRGVPGELPADFDRRFSFCCDREGCRKRNTPPSVRYLDRKVYAGFVIVLASAMRYGASRRRARRIREEIGVSVRTIYRWRKWWRENFVESRHWRAMRGLVAVPVDEADLPRSLLGTFPGSVAEKVVALLKSLRRSA